MDLEVRSRLGWDRSASRIFRVLADWGAAGSESLAGIFYFNATKIYYFNQKSIDF